MSENKYHLQVPYKTSLSVHEILISLEENKKYQIYNSIKPRIKFIEGQ